jgi:hypothetical protein
MIRVVFRFAAVAALLCAAPERLAQAFSDMNDSWKKIAA